jgi:NADH:ubiquinone oxidoreductase subunit 3 (subunit A)
LFWLLGIAILLVKTSLELYFLMPVAAFFGKEKELIWFPFLQPIHILYIVSAGFLGVFGKYEWKGRKVG